MNDENNTTTEETPEAPENKTPAAVALFQIISERIKGSDQAIKDKVVEARVQAEIDKRASALDSALKKRVELEGEVKKLQRPTSEVYDANGNVVHAGFSKSDVKALAEAKKKLAKADKCIAAALEGGDWGKLNEVK